MNSIRVCHPADYFGFLEYDEAKDSFFGAASFIANDIFATFKTISAKRNHTVTMQPRRGYGEPVPNGNGSYSGCIGQLQTNQSDTMMMLVDYPSNIENVSVGMIVTSANLDIGAAYTFEEHELSTILSMFTSFDVPLYLVILMSLLIIWSVTRVKSHLDRSLFGKMNFSTIGNSSSKSQLEVSTRNKVAPVTDELAVQLGPHKKPVKRMKSALVEKMARFNLFKLILHFLKINTLEAVTLFERLIFLTVSVMSFLLLFHFCSLIKTELVVIKDPFIIRTYEDIVKYKVKPVFMKGLYHHYHYKYATKGSLEREVWAKSVQRYGVDKVLIGLDFSALFHLLFEVFDKKTVVMFDDLVSGIMTKSICELKAKEFGRLAALSSVFMVQKGKGKNTSNSNPESSGPTLTSSPSFIVSVDPNAKNIIKGALLSAGMQVSRAGKSIAKRLARMFEMGFFIAVKQRAQSINIAKHGPKEMVEFLGPGAKDKLDSVRDCYSPTPVKPDVKLYGLTFESFSSVFTLLIALISTAGLCLNFEMFRVMKKSKKMSTVL